MAPRPLPPGGVPRSPYSRRSVEAVYPPPASPVVGVLGALLSRLRTSSMTPCVRPASGCAAASKVDRYLPRGCRSTRREGWTADRHGRAGVHRHPPAIRGTGALNLWSRQGRRPAFAPPASPAGTRHLRSGSRSRFALFMMGTVNCETTFPNLPPFLAHVQEQFRRLGGVTQYEMLRTRCGRTSRWPPILVSRPLKALPPRS